MQEIERTGYTPEPAPSRADFDAGFKLVVYVYCARDITAADVGIAGSNAVVSGMNKDSSDPYVQVKFGSQVQKTVVRYMTLMPAWNETLEFDVNRSHFSSSEQLEVDLFDYDLLSQDDHIGSFRVEVLGGGPRFHKENNWIPLRGGKIKKGELNLWWCYKGLSSRVNSPERSPVCSQGVQVHLVHLLGWDHRAQRFQIKVKLNGRYEETRVTERTERPSWDETIPFPAEALDETGINTVEIKVYTYHQENFLRPKHKIGYLLLTVPSEERPQDKVPVPRPITNVDPEPPRYQLVSAIYRGARMR